FAESPTSGARLYFETLGTLLVHEIVRLNCGVPSIQPQVRGGLAPWQQRIVTAYIEEHLKERISLATLAQLIRLSHGISAGHSSILLVHRRIGTRPIVVWSMPSCYWQRGRSR